MRERACPQSIPPHSWGVISYAFVDGFTAIPRVEALERLKRAIAVADGVIADFAFFGAPAHAIRLTVELDAAGVATLQRALAGSEIELFARCSRELEEARTMNHHRPILAMLHILFASNAVTPTGVAA